MSNYILGPVHKAIYSSVVINDPLEVGVLPDQKRRAWVLADMARQFSREGVEWSLYVDNNLFFVVSYREALLWLATPEALQVSALLDVLIGNNHLLRNYYSHGALEGRYLKPSEKAEQLEAETDAVEERIMALQPAILKAAEDSFSAADTKAERTSSVEEEQDAVTLVDALEDKARVTLIDIFGTEPMEHHSIFADTGEGKTSRGRSKVMFLDPWAGLAEQKNREVEKDPFDAYFHGTEEAMKVAFIAPLVVIPAVLMAGGLLFRHFSRKKRM